VLGVFTDVESTLHFAESGVVLLLFVIGLELQPSRLWVLRHAVFGGGAARVLLTAPGLALAVRLAGRWSQVLAPLEAEAAQRLRAWLPKLRYPIRVGEHSQTAFAFGLVHDWARATGDTGMQQLLESRSREYYGNDVNCPLAYEPSGEDFLSPCIAEAARPPVTGEHHAGGHWLGTFAVYLTSRAGLQAR
jgi:hypothetical protein